MKHKPLTAAAITLLILTSCSGIRLKDYKAETCTKLPGEKTVSVINRKCGLCHKGDFASKELICTRKAMINDAVTSGRMPKIGSLSAEEIEIIRQWEL